MSKRASLGSIFPVWKCADKYKSLKTQILSVHLLLKEEFKKKKNWVIPTAKLICFSKNVRPLQTVQNGPMSCGRWNIASHASTYQYIVFQMSEYWLCFFFLYSCVSKMSEYWIYRGENALLFISLSINLRV